LQQVNLEPEQIGEKTVTVVSQSQLASKLGLHPEQTTPSTLVPKPPNRRCSPRPEDQKVAQIAYAVIRKLENQPQTLPSVSHLTNADVQAAVAKEVAAQYRPSQLELEGVAAKPDIAAIVAKTSALVIQQTIDIPRILVVPTGEVQSGFNPFTLQLAALNYPPVSEELRAKHLRTDQVGCHCHRQRRHRGIAAGGLRCQRSGRLRRRLL
jgi:type III restriction enzyme